jgi:ERCC4-related helicase
MDKITKSDQFGHLIADDVGLGKTIEAGLIITRYLKENRNGRILVVCPAGLVLQWQDEMADHFDLYFSIVNHDFDGQRQQEWETHNLIIASLDTVKSKRYNKIFNKTSPFDLILCDECHRVSARKDFIGNEIRRTENYRLFEEFISNGTISFVNKNNNSTVSPRFLFLSATPHQGDDTRFLLLLKLLRPDLVHDHKDNNVLKDPNILKQIVSRTPKNRAFDWNGKPLFKGHITMTHEVFWKIQENELSKKISKYLNKCFKSSGSDNALILALTMHTFHKIAASSSHALKKAMQRRLQSVQGFTTDNESLCEIWEDAEDEDTSRKMIKGVEHRDSFYEEEDVDIREIIDNIDSLEIDSKWEMCREILENELSNDPNAKFLIFTQYYGTQMYLKSRLKNAFPLDKIEVINGAMNVDARKEAKTSFEGSSRFLISTEAGGEGINLHKVCHILVNYDIPWNPMRLQQRIGRLDRYGQKEVVRVHNIIVPESWDAHIMNRIMGRLEIIQKQMGAVVDDVEDYKSMILGSITDKINPEEQFTNHLNGKELTNEEIDSIIKPSIESLSGWKEIFSSELGMTPENMPDRPNLTSLDFKQTFEVCLASKGIHLSDTRTSEHKFLKDVHHFTLPEGFRDRRIRPNREKYIVFDRELYQEVRNTTIGTARGQSIRPELAGFGDAITDWVLESAFTPSKNQSFFHINLSNDSWSYGSGWLFIASARWMADNRKLKAPDILIPCFQSYDGDELKQVPLNDLFHLAKDAKPATTPKPELKLEKVEEGVLQIVKQVLSPILIGRSTGNSDKAGWAMHMLVRVDCVN